MPFVTVQHTPGTHKRIAFLSSRISGTDGVSLEIGKWARVLESMGHICFYIAGLCDDRLGNRIYAIPQAHFQHPIVAEINRQCFGYEKRNPEVTEKIKEMTWIIKKYAEWSRTPPIERLWLTTTLKWADGFSPMPE